ncbi:MULTISPECIES: LysR family transcriptional regulator [unclassified Beijerinckia]|uniref:LysR family transcriptional regulator n=1 Tax=unclassified Beijerinckia TaxID=2638183 RepID=UPI00089589A1|nr:MULTISPECIES: LysR family transcriptional regulator [unclassified Beijerinckia]MDH7795424.1 DNA-binding transcriptional LysR family regulator [Beijerinckia sp. GAS462]SEC00966.1 transcriptional regulator, LysR family [Beijerinckia sp. 28-YEA-48]
MDHVGALGVFVQAADARSFTTAGHQLGISSSAVGKAITRLEERLGTRLFHRSTRTITLTPEGAMFLERCRRILGEIEAAEMELAQAQGAPRGTLRVSLPIVNALMMPAFNAFMRAYPEVQLDLDFSDQLVDVIDGGFDAVIRAGEVSDSRLMSRVLGEFHLKLVASPAYLARKGTPHRPEDLLAHACLLHKFATSRKFERWPLRRAGRDLDLALPPAAIANTIEPLLQMAEDGLGIACLPDMMLHQQLKHGRLKTVLDDYVSHAGTMRILWPSSRYLAPKLRVFIDFMSETLFQET